MSEGRKEMASKPSGVFASGIGAPEGPVSLADGGLYVTEMSATTLCISKLDPQGQRSVIARTGGRPNGLAVDGDGMIWVAEAGQRALVCIAPDGRELRRLDHTQDGQRFLFPNDLAFGPNGLLYLTDSGMVVEDFLNGQEFYEGYRNFNWDGRVYEIDPGANKVLRVIDRGILFTNGIAFDAADRLYANSSFSGDVYRYDVLGAARPQRELFGNVLQPFEGDDFQGPDGMKFGADGRLYCTVYGQGNVTVLDASGKVAERLALQGRCPTNCAFALDEKKLLVTEVSIGQVERLDVPCSGLALHAPKVGVRH